MRPLGLAWAVVLAWAAGGLARPALSDEPYGRFQFEETERDHWAFLPVVPPAVPEVDDPAWSANPIDRFWKARWDEEGIEPAPEATPVALLRRVYFDLVGLPPTPAEQDRFLADPSPDAYSRLVDELLTRPEYAERWGRHWLDVVRYAESNGYERDGAKPHAWRYRDWVIDALHRDKPFDRFLLEQVAGDELPDADVHSRIATTFLRLGPWDDEPADPEVDRYDQLDDVLGTTVTTFLGLTIRCARCHDHKYEPFKQQDYARLLATFEPLVRPQQGRADLDAFACSPEEQSAYEAGLASANQTIQARAQELDECRAGALERLAAEGKSQLPLDLVAALRAPAEKRQPDQQKLVADHLAKLDEEMQNSGDSEMTSRFSSARQALEAAQAQRPPEPTRAYVWRERTDQLPVTHVFHRGDPRSPREEIAPGFPAVLVEGPPPPPTPTGKTSGRRLALAHWLVDPAHPLTSRVYVNRLWQHHFGDGLVATENDFGVMGEPPVHQELLDWLAAELVAGGWRTKPLHRLIVLSATYRRAAAATTSGQELDPDVRLCWRRKPLRLEAEAVRDAVLATSGALSTARGGPSVFPEISAEVLAGQSRPGDGWKRTEPAAESNRRSVYVFVKRTLPLPELEVLDFPCPDQSCEQRQTSTVPTQALTYWNGKFMHEQARLWAERLVRETGTDTAAAIRLALRLAYCREPAPEELALLESFVAGQVAAGTAARESAPAEGETGAAALAPEVRALASLCLVLLNSNEFVYIE